VKLEFEIELDRGFFGKHDLVSDEATNMRPERNRPGTTRSLPRWTRFDPESARPDGTKVGHRPRWQCS